MQPVHWILVTLIAAWASVILGAMWQANQRALQRHRERLAMIEKGLPLPPDVSPPSPWRALRGETHADNGAGRENRLLDFIRFIGLLTIAGGVGSYFLLTIIDQWRAGVGVGGLMLIVGTALILTTTRAAMIRLAGDRHDDDQRRQ